MATISTAHERGIRFHYVRDRRRKFVHVLDNGRTSRGAPIACIISQTDAANSVIRFGIATVHSQYDCFNYTTAQGIAATRLVLSPIELKVKSIPTAGRDITKLIMEYLYSSDDVSTVPSRVKSWAGKWLDHIGDLEMNRDLQNASTVGTSFSNAEHEAAKKHGMTLPASPVAVPKDRDTVPMMDDVPPKSPGRMVPKFN
jgi:hypothetical protein